MIVTIASACCLDTRPASPSDAAHGFRQARRTSRPGSAVFRVPGTHRGPPITERREEQLRDAVEARLVAQRRVHAHVEPDLLVCLPLIVPDLHLRPVLEAKLL